MLIRGCAYNGSSVTSWDADLISDGSDIDEILKKDILGSRRTLLFIEGEEQSLDKPLYSLLFPEVSVIPKVSCRDVDHAVSGIRSSHSLHWLHAFGIVDNDTRTAEDLMRLHEKGIYALSVHSVESLYYHPEMLRRVAVKHASVTGEDPAVLCELAKDAAFAAINPHIRRLSERAVERSIRGEIDKHRPRLSDISAGTPIRIQVDVERIVLAEANDLRQAIERSDLERIVSRYPVRETPMLTEVARKLGFQSRSQYENVVRKLVMDDSTALEFLRSLFDTLFVDMFGAEPAQQDFQTEVLP